MERQYVCSSKSQSCYFPGSRFEIKSGHMSSSSSDESSSEECTTKSKGYWKKHPYDPAWYLLSDCIDNDFDSDKSDWFFIDPLSDSSYSISNSHLSISVPQGDHDPYTSFKAPRYVTSATRLQDINDFEIETKMISIMSKRYQIQGIAIEQDPLNYIRFETFHDGNTTHIYVQPTIGGVNQPAINIIPFGSGPSPSPLWMRVQRTGNSWVCKYSTDGITFTSTTPKIVNLNTNNVGVYVGNAIGTISPAHTGIFEYFKELQCQSLGKDSEFFLSGYTWWEVISMKNKYISNEEKLYYKLAKQYIAAVLNVLSGQEPDQWVQNCIDESKALLEQFSPDQVPGKHETLRLADCLDSFNNCQSYYYSDSSEDSSW